MNALLSACLAPLLLFIGGIVCIVFAAIRKKRAWWIGAAACFLASILVFFGPLFNLLPGIAGAAKDSLKDRRVPVPGTPASFMVPSALREGSSVRKRSAWAVYLENLKREWAVFVTTENREGMEIDDPKTFHRIAAEFAASRAEALGNPVAEGKSVSLNGLEAYRQVYKKKGTGIQPDSSAIHYLILGENHLYELVGASSSDLWRDPLIQVVDSIARTFIEGEPPDPPAESTAAGDP